MKNWEPFVLGPAFAMLSTPSPVCLTAATDHSGSTQGTTLLVESCVEAVLKLVRTVLYVLKLVRTVPYVLKH